MFGTPAIPLNKQKKIEVISRQLPEMHKKFKIMEKTIDELKEKIRKLEKGE